jgi:hypothetical protein
MGETPRVAANLAALIHLDQMERIVSLFSRKAKIAKETKWIDLGRWFVISEI